MGLFTWRCEVWILLDYGPGRRGGRCRRRLHWRQQGLVGLPPLLDWSHCRCLLPQGRRQSLLRRSGRVQLRGRVQLCGCHGLHIHGHVHRRCAVQTGLELSSMATLRDSLREAKCLKLALGADQTKTCKNKTDILRACFQLLSSTCRLQFSQQPSEIWDGVGPARPPRADKAQVLANSSGTFFRPPKSYHRTPFFFPFCGCQRRTRAWP